MELSNATIDLLSFCNKINGEIKIDAGNKIYSKSISGAMCLYAEIKETFPNPFVTGSLLTFLSSIKLFSNPDFDFTKDEVIISEKNGRSNVRIPQSNPEVIQQNNLLPKPQTDIAISFQFKASDLAAIFKACGNLSVNDINIVAKDGKIVAISKNNAAPTTNRFETEIGVCDPSLDLEFNFKKQHLILMENMDYDVEVSTRGLSIFTAINTDKYNVLKIYVVTNITNR